jgi:hypothetical protein
MDYDRAMRLRLGLVTSALAFACSGCSSTSLQEASKSDGGDGSVRTDTGRDVAVTEAAAPSLLISLAVSPLALTPAFSPSIHDYYVRCAAGENALTVTTTAAPGGTVALLQPITTTPAASDTAKVVVAENQAVVVTAAHGAASTEYWVRCLPSTFPQLAMDPHPESGTLVPGYYLVGNTGAARGEGEYAMVLDGNGVPVWYSTTMTGAGPADVESLTPNSISFVGWLGRTLTNTSAGEYETHDLSTNGITYQASVGEPLDPHELQRLPNGDYLVLSAKITPGVDLTGLGSFGANEDMIGCDVQEVDANGGVVWQWTATDHFDPVKDSIWPQPAPVSGKTVVDVFHCNSIDIAADGDLLISARQMNSVFLVSKVTGAVLWKIGGAQYTKEGAPYLTVTGDPLTAFYGQHDARLLPNGQVGVFDDHTGMPGPARGVIYSYDVSAGTATLAWQFKGQVGAAAMGSFRVTADGSRIIGWGETGGQQSVFTEVDEDGNDLLDFNLSRGDYSFRALKVPLTQLDLTLMRTTAGADTHGGVPDAGAADAGSGDATTETGADARVD